MLMHSKYKDRQRIRDNPNWKADLAIDRHDKKIVDIFSKFIQVLQLYDSLPLGADPRAREERRGEGGELSEQKAKENC